jgi:hypothetical protein
VAPPGQLAENVASGTAIRTSQSPKSSKEVVLTISAAGTGKHCPFTSGIKNKLKNRAKSRDITRNEAVEIINRDPEDF